jgi:hypothetical protein
MLSKMAGGLCLAPALHHSSMCKSYRHVSALYLHAQETFSTSSIKEVALPRNALRAQQVK